MKPLTQQNIESEISYAYLHAVASYAGVGCEVTGRHADNAGIDARLTGWGPFPDGGYRQEVDLNVQLKATSRAPASTNDFLSYPLHGIQRYDDLRSEALSTPRILVVLFLSESREDWLSHSADELILRKCAYWVCLRGAAESANETSQTVYLPQSQLFDPDGLKALLSQISRNNIPKYQPPDGGAS